MKLKGRIWVLLDKKGELIRDIDTDQIYHNAYLHITDISQMGQYALGNLEGWEDFSRRAQPGDILMAGRNFGAGSSRQQAVDCFVSLKIGLIVAPSFGAIYYRNAINSGFPVLRCPELEKLVSEKRMETGDQVEINLGDGQGKNISRDFLFSSEPMSSVQRDIYNAGGLFSYEKSRE
ncbi:MAG: 3-isopropylmalate dehydratase [Candidatus Aminicenantes bacterium]